MTAQQATATAWDEYRKAAKAWVENPTWETNRAMALAANKWADAKNQQQQPEGA